MPADGGTRGNPSVGWVDRIFSGYAPKLLLLTVLTAAVYPFYFLLLKIRPRSHSGP